MVYIPICLSHFFVLFLPYWEAVFREKKKNNASAHMPVFQIYLISSTHLPPYLFHNNYVKNIWRNFSSLASKVSSLLVTLILKSPATLIVTALQNSLSKAHYSLIKTTLVYHDLR